MGTIRIGRVNQKTYEAGSITTGEAAQSAPKKQMNEEEKAKFLESVQQLPKDKWVSALRNAGLEEEANECEKALAEEHLRELNAKNRAKRLAEIHAMEDEEERLAVLIDEGFADEAKELAEQLSIKSEEGGGLDEGTGEGQGAGLDGEASDTTADEGGESGGDNPDEAPEPANDGTGEENKAPEEQPEAVAQEEKPATEKRGGRRAVKK